jgi:putative transposase
MRLPHHHSGHTVGQQVSVSLSLSHETSRVRERGMRRFKSMTQAQRFVTAHAAVRNLFKRWLDIHGLDFYGISDFTCQYR